MLGLAAGSARVEVKAALGSDDLASLQAKTEALAQASMKVGEALYKAGQEQAAAGGAPGGGDGGGQAGGDKVVDADFEEVDDDHKKKSA